MTLERRFGSNGRCYRHAASRKPLLPIATDMCGYPRSDEQPEPLVGGNLTVLAPGNQNQRTSNRLWRLVGAGRFERPTPCAQAR